MYAASMLLLLFACEHAGTAVRTADSGGNGDSDATSVDSTATADSTTTLDSASDSAAGGDTGTCTPATWSIDDCPALASPWALNSAADFGAARSMGLFWFDPEQDAVDDSEADGCPSYDAATATYSGDCSTASGVNYVGTITLSSAEDDGHSATRYTFSGFAESAADGSYRLAVDGVWDWWRDGDVGEYFLDLSLSVAGTAPPCHACLATLPVGNVEIAGLLAYNADEWWMDGQVNVASSPVGAGEFCEEQSNNEIDIAGSQAATWVADAADDWGSCGCLTLGDDPTAAEPYCLQ